MLHIGIYRMTFADMYYVLSMYSQWLLAYCYTQPPGTLGLSNLALVCSWIDDRISMSISVDSPSDETLNQDPLALLLWQQYEFPFWISVVQF